MLLSFLGYCAAMSDLNTAVISDDLASGLIVNLKTDVDGAEVVTSVKATMDCNNLLEEECMMTTYPVSTQDVHGSDNVKECVWEACYTVPKPPINSNASKRELHQDDSQELNLEFCHSLKPQNLVKSHNLIKQKNSAKSKSKRKANKKKKSMHCSSEKANLNLDHRNDSCYLVEKVSLPVQGGNGLSLVSSVTSAVAECVENVTVDRSIELSAGFCCAHEESACNGDGVNLLETAAQSTSVCQEGLVGLSDKNIFPGNSDENKNVLSDDILLEKDCQEKVELLKYTTLLNFCDLAPSSNDHINNFIEPAVAECLPSSVEENIFACEEQKEVIFKKKRRKSQRIKARLCINMELENEKHVCSEPDGLFAVEGHEECAENTAVQGIVKLL